MSKSIAKILNEAADLIADRNRFDRLHTAERYIMEGKPETIGCLGTDPRAKWWNASGAIIKVGGSWEKARDAWMHFRASVCPDGGGLYSWVLSSTHEGQVEALRTAAAAAERAR